jgi:hypothetical protein
VLFYLTRSQLQHPQVRAGAFFDSLRAYVRAQTGKEITLAGQTNFITEKGYLDKLDHIQGGAYIDVHGKLPGGNSPVRPPSSKSPENGQALVFHSYYRRKAKWVYVDFDWSGPCEFNRAAAPEQSAMQRTQSMDLLGAQRQLRRLWISYEINAALY